LLGAAFEPTAALGAKCLRFFKLSHAEESAIELAGSGFAAFGSGESGCDRNVRFETSYLVENIGPRPILLVARQKVVCQSPIGSFIGRCQATDQANKTKVRSRREPYSPRKSAHAERYGKSDTEDVYDHSDDHHPNGKRPLGDGREW